jgi:predicted dehydrogenase
MREKMFRGAIIGFGRMGVTHYSILNRNPYVQFVGVCDQSDFILKTAKRFIHIDTFKDYQTLIDAKTPDFIVVATPTGYHVETAAYAIEKGIHVFVEKPFALNTKQGQQLLTLINGKNIINQVGYVIRFNDVFLKVRELLQDNALGDLLLFKMEMNGPTLLNNAQSSWRSKKHKGGGCLYDFASHSVDLINYLIGPPDEIVGTVFQSIHSVGVEDALSSTFLYKNGVRGNLLVNWSDPTYRKPAYHFEVLGRKGKIIADLHAYKVFFQENPEKEGFTQGWNQKYITDFAEPVDYYLRGYEFTRQLEHFVNCILEKTVSDVCSFKDGYITDSIIERIRQDAERSRGEDGQNHLWR